MSDERQYNENNRELTTSKLSVSRAQIAAEKAEKLKAQRAAQLQKNKAQTTELESQVKQSDEELKAQQRKLEEEEAKRLALEQEAQELENKKQDTADKLKTAQEAAAIVQERIQHTKRQRDTIVDTQPNKKQKAEQLIQNVSKLFTQRMSVATNFFNTTVKTIIIQSCEKALVNLANTVEMMKVEMTDVAEQSNLVPIAYNEPIDLPDQPRCYKYFKGQIEALFNIDPKDKNYVFIKAWLLNRLFDEFATGEYNELAGYTDEQNNKIVFLGVSVCVLLTRMCMEYIHAYTDVNTISLGVAIHNYSLAIDNWTNGPLKDIFQTPYDETIPALKITPEQVKLLQKMAGDMKRMFNVSVLTTTSDNSDLYKNLEIRFQDWRFKTFKINDISYGTQLPAIHNVIFNKDQRLREMKLIWRNKFFYEFILAIMVITRDAFEIQRLGLITDIIQIGVLLYLNWTMIYRYYLLYVSHLTGIASTKAAMGLIIFNIMAELLIFYCPQTALLFGKDFDNARPLKLELIVGLNVISLPLLMAKNSQYFGYVDGVIACTQQGLDLFYTLLKSVSTVSYQMMQSNAGVKAATTIASVAVLGTISIRSASDAPYIMTTFSDILESGHVQLTDLMDTYVFSTLQGEIFETVGRTYTRVPEEGALIGTANIRILPNYQLKAYKRTTEKYKEEQLAQDIVSRYFTAWEGAVYDFSLINALSNPRTASYEMYKLNAFVNIMFPRRLNPINAMSLAIQLKKDNAMTFENYHKGCVYMASILEAYFDGWSEIELFIKENIDVKKRTLVKQNAFKFYHSKFGFGIEKGFLFNKEDVVNVRGYCDTLLTLSTPLTISRDPLNEKEILDRIKNYTLTKSINAPVVALKVGGYEITNDDVYAKYFQIGDPKQRNTGQKLIMYKLFTFILATIATRTIPNITTMGEDTNILDVNLQQGVRLPFSRILDDIKDADTTNLKDETEQFAVDIKHDGNYTELYKWIDKNVNNNKITDNPTALKPATASGAFQQDGSQNAGFNYAKNTIKMAVPLDFDSTMTMNVYGTALYRLAEELNINTYKGLLDIVLSEEKQYKNCFYNSKSYTEAADKCFKVYVTESSLQFNTVPATLTETWRSISIMTNELFVMFRDLALKSQVINQTNKPLDVKLGQTIADVITGRTGELNLFSGMFLFDQLGKFMAVLYALGKLATSSTAVEASISGLGVVLGFKVYKLELAIQMLLATFVFFSTQIGLTRWAFGTKPRLLNRNTLMTATYNPATVEVLNQQRALEDRITARGIEGFEDYAYEDHIKAFNISKTLVDNHASPIATYLSSDQMEFFSDYILQILQNEKDLTLV